MAHNIVTWLNNKEGETIYAAFDSNMKKAISHENWTDVSAKQLYPLTPFITDRFLNSSGGSNFYLLKTTAANWTLQVAVNDQNQVSTLFLAPVKQEAKPQINKGFIWHDNALQNHTDSLVHSIAMLQLREGNTPGMSIGILNGLKAFYYNYGEANREASLQPMATTLYEIGSITKTFTAFVLADAVVKNKVTLEDPIIKYLPANVAENKNLQTITLLQLANHTSGLPRLPTNAFEGIKNQLDPYADYDTVKLYSFLQSVKPQHQPGEQYEYSNLGFGLLGVILEKVYQQPLEDLYQQLIFRPFKMNSTYATAVKDTLITAIGYNEKDQRTSYWNFKSMTGAGAIKSNTQDLLKYALQFTMKPRTNGKTDPRIELLEKITFSKDFTFVSLGWHFENPEKPEQVMNHNGGTGGFRTEIDICASKKLAVVVLCNSAREPSATVAAKQIMKELMQ